MVYVGLCPRDGEEHNKGHRLHTLLEAMILECQTMLRLQKVYIQVFLFPIFRIKIDFLHFFYKITAI